MRIRTSHKHTLAACYLGCMGGPAAVSLCTEAFAGGSLKGGMLFGVIFPLGLVIGLVILNRIHRSFTSDPS